MPRPRSELSHATALAVALALALVALLPAGARAQADALPLLPEPRPHPIVVGADRHYPPYEFVDKDGSPAGFNVDLTRAVAEVMGMPVEFRFGDWAEIRGGFAAGAIDVLQGISWSEERARRLDFAPPNAIVHHAIFARTDGPRFSSLEALRGRTVLVFGGGIMDEALTRLGGVALVRTGTPADALRRLSAGEGDAVAVALLPGTWLVRELGLSNVRVVANRVAAERYGYAVQKGNAELLARFETGLAILKKTGRWDQIHDRWLGPLEPRTDWATVVRWVAGVALPLLALLAGAVLWTRSLHRLVGQRTASLEREVAEKERALRELERHEAELVKKQAELVQADKMAALGVLVSGVAHEINNPNGLVLLGVPTVRAAFEDARPVLDAAHREDPGLVVGGIAWPRMREEVPRVLDDMLAAGRRIQRIVEDLKSFARREDAPALEATDLNEVARAAVRIVDPTLRKATRRFELALGAGLPRVQAQPHRIEQVVVNLLVNACQALPAPDAAVRLSTRHDAAAGRVVLEVADEGVGIAPDDLRRITEPFFTTRRTTGGTGLGLSVSARIVEEHGGRLAFASEVGRGTRATLALPEAPRPEART